MISIGVVANSNRSNKSSNNGLPEALSVTIPSSMVVGGTYSASYTYHSEAGILEDNEPPFAEELFISGLQKVGEVLTATFINLVIPNGQPEGTHQYQWHRAANGQQKSEFLIPGATDDQYTLVDADAGNVLRCVAIPVQTNGGNIYGEAVLSTFTGYIQALNFEPITYIAWQTAYSEVDLANYTANGYWLGRGSLQADAVKDDIYNMPTYDSTQNALSFLRANTERLLFKKQSPTWTNPYEIQIKFKIRALTGNQYLFGFTNSYYIYYNSTGFLNICGSPSSLQLVAGTWYTMRIVIDGTSTTVEVNNQAPISVLVSSTSVPSTGSGRIGCSFAKGNFFNGWIKDIFIIDTPLSPTDQTNMWNWFTPF